MPLSTCVSQPEDELGGFAGGDRSTEPLDLLAPAPSPWTVLRCRGLAIRASWRKSSAPRPTATACAHRSSFRSSTVPR